MIFVILANPVEGTAGFLLMVLVKNLKGGLEKKNEKKEHGNVHEKENVHEIVNMKGITPLRSPAPVTRRCALERAA